MDTPSDPQLDSLKVLPHSIEVEQSVLGGLLLDNAAWDRIADFISKYDFHCYDHRLIFHSIGKLIPQVRPADVTTVFEQLQAAGKAEKVGDLVHLNALVQNTPSAASIRRCAEVVRDRGVLHQLVTITNKVSAGAFNLQGRDARRLLDEAESKVFTIAEEGSHGQKGFLGIQPLLTQVVKRIDELYHRDNQSDITGVPMDFIDLDRITSDIQGGDLTIVAGRPSIGKTAPSLNIGERVAVKQGLSVVMLSMEMVDTQLATRMLGSVG